MQYLLLYLAAIYLLLAAVTYLLIFQRVMGIAFQHPRYKLKLDDDVPVYLKQTFEQPIAELNALGFQACTYIEIEPALKRGDAKTWELLLYHTAFKTYASIAIRFPLEVANPFDIEFLTFFKDKDLLLTMNGKRYGLIGEIPKTIVQDPYAVSLEAQWQAHQETLKQVAETKTSCGLAPAACVRALEAHFGTQIDLLIKTKQLVPVKGTQQFQLRWQAALKLAIKLKQGMKQATALTKQHNQRAKTNPTHHVDIPVELEVEGFCYQQQIEQGQVKRKLGIWVLLGSLVLSIASFTPLFDFKALVILIGVLFLHELGHFLAMRLFGYQDTSMFFLPFFGAAVTGRKDDASLTEKVWVLLAGPLPGLLLGIGLAIGYRDTAYAAWAKEGIWMLIGINLFNLLPIYPLDGGKISSLLVFSRYPYADVMFKVFAVIVLVLLGMGSPIAFGIAVIVAATIPAGYRSAKVDAKLRKEFPSLSLSEKTPLLHAVFKTLKELGYGTLPFVHRYSLAKEVVQRHQESRARWFTRLTLSVFYCLTLLGGIVGTLQAFTPNWQQLVTTSQNYKTQAKQEIATATKTLASNPDDVQAYIKRSRMRLLLRDYKGAIADAEQVVRLNPNSADGYFLQSSACYGLGDRTGAEAARRKGETITQTNILRTANQALQRNPKDITAYLKRGHIRSRQRDYKGALADFNQILKLDAKNTQAFLSRGEVRYQLKDYKNAIADANYAIKFDPNSVDAYYLRSDARRQIGDIKGATADEQKGDELYQQEEQLSEQNQE